MGLEEFSTSGNSSTTYNSGSGYRTDSDSEYKDKEWLSNQLEDRSIQDIADQFGVAYNTIYYQINKYDLNESEREYENEVERYIAQFIEGDGTIQLNTNSRGKDSTFTPHVSAANTFDVEIASLIDAEGSISFRAQKQPNGKFGYKQIASITTAQTFQNQQIAALRRFKSMIDTFCESIDIEPKYSFTERDTNVLIRWSVSRWDDVAEVLDTIRKHLVLKVEIANIFLNKIYPMYQKREHRTEEGFIEMAGYADEMAMLRDGNGKRKYTQEYFTNKKRENW